MKWTLIKVIAGRWLAPALLALAVVGIGSAWWHGYQTGQSVAHSDQQKQIEALRDRAAVLADELEAARGDRRIEYRDRIRTVYREADPSGCADAAVPVGVLNAIRDATGQPADSAVRQAATAGRNEP